MELQLILSRYCLRPVFLLALLTCLFTVGCSLGTSRVIVITATPPAQGAAPDTGSVPPDPNVVQAPQNSTTLPQFIPGNPTPDSPRRQTVSGDVQQHVVQPGDTLFGIASAYGLSLDTILASNELANPDVLEVGQVIQLPGLPSEETPDFKIIPDSRLVRAPGSSAFDVAGFIVQLPGYIRTATDEVGTNQADGTERKETLTAAQIVERVSLEYSVDPRVLLALLEFRAGWLSTAQVRPDLQTHPMISEEDSGNIDREGLYRQLAWTANQLNFGYYGWKTRGWVALEFERDERLLYNNGLNAGTVALQYFLSLNNDFTGWVRQVSSAGFFQVYYAYFGDPFANPVEPLVPSGLVQPPMTFPFSSGETWFFTGGAHGGWGSGSAWAAIDFAPPDVPQTGVACYTSQFWVTASASGLIARSGGGAVVLDLDGDGDETTGWTILYLHIASEGRVTEGTTVQVGDRIGRASCEGGFSTATHMHIARRYNGEWIPASCDECAPGDERPQMNLSGWEVVGYRDQEYQGYMEKDGERRLAEQGRNSTENRVSW
ncbi:MAG: LysM peptidoglycan-binding domain-containing protein [bacterium]|nr:LysM peptidoglycan-binding domain-containing protein [bacterium]